MRRPATRETFPASPLPAALVAYLEANHVVSLATAAGGAPWAASCFYAFEARSAALVILTSEKTRHGLAMCENPLVAGTVASQPTSIRDIRGLQFLAEARRPDGAEKQASYVLYCRRHPVALLRPETVWRLVLLEAKLTDNANGFGSKTLWSRNAPNPPV